jgi:pilus assembly protein Flp/PilA
MTYLMDKLFSAVSRREQGQGLAEYALILALIAVVAILALVFLGSRISSILSTVGSRL